jgi:LysM repeat protein
MNENPDNEMKEFREKVAGDLGYSRKDGAIRRRAASLAFKAHRKTLIAGAGILLLIILIALFSRGGDELSSEDVPSIQLRLNQLERRIARLEGMEEMVIFLEQQEKQLQQSMAEAEQSRTSLTARVAKLSQKVEGLQNRTASLPAKTESPPTIKRRALPSAKGRYHEVRPGDSLYRIARQYGTSVGELCRLNNMTANQLIYAGQKLLVPSH